ncbi:hypothetical protein WI61_36950 [Burkholderia cepacia]|nr:hypothetical protein WI50_06505 [Burkholderia cepacia]KVB04470.1 hypothetical protein WI55_25920 [Burkholderia cepacia]KVB39763.1 hypothetical protein WI57_34775 [Burkholderia cepacia]KVB55077.1 hypothetical protein WI60_17670 [Burkholderia cepacia]KVB64043.1 hypothetical protein WI61_36950 [Burkholderia cepacia]
MVAGIEVEEFHVCTTYYLICSGQPPSNVEIHYCTRLNDMSFTARYHYDDECDAPRCRRLKSWKVGRSGK